MSGFVSQHSVLATGALAVGVAAGICAARAWYYGARSTAVAAEDPYVAIFRARSARDCDALAAAIRLRTVSSEPHMHGRCGAVGEVPEPEPVEEAAAGAAAHGCCGGGRSALLAMHALLAERFPVAHARCEVHVINELSLVYILRGSDSSLKPVCFMAHMCVDGCSAQPPLPPPPLRLLLLLLLPCYRRRIFTRGCTRWLQGRCSMPPARVVDSSPV